MVPSPGAFHFNTALRLMTCVFGTLASLVGVEDALAESSRFLDMALRRARMMYGVIMSIGGIPLIYMGEVRCTQRLFVFERCRQAR